MKATVPSMSWNSPGSVVWEVSLAAAPKSAMRNLCPVESIRIFPPKWDGCGGMGACVCVCVCIMHACTPSLGSTHKVQLPPTFQVSVDDPILMQEDNAVDDLPGIVADNTIREGAKVMEQLIQAASCQRANTVAFSVCHCCHEHSLLM